MKIKKEQVTVKQFKAVQHKSLHTPSRYNVFNLHAIYFGSGVDRYGEQSGVFRFFRGTSRSILWHLRCVASTLSVYQWSSLVSIKGSLINFIQCLRVNIVDG